MLTTLKHSIKYRLDIYRMHSIHNHAKHVLNNALIHNGQKFSITFNATDACNNVIGACDNVVLALVKFDSIMTIKENKKLGAKEFTLYKILTKPVEKIQKHINDDFSDAYYSLIIAALLIASFMDRYNLGTDDWSSSASKHYKRLELNQKTFDPKETLYDAIMKPYRLFTVHDAGKLVRQAYLDERS